jgi:hypothetical protein
MRTPKGIKSSLDSDGNLETSFGKECDVTNLQIEPGYRHYYPTQFTTTVHDEDYKEVRLTMDVYLLAQILQMLAADLDYHEFDSRECHQIHELSELIVKMKQAEVPA